jgi:anaerobic ribonucleoside-triphosphate reductase activating protein
MTHAGGHRSGGTLTVARALSPLTVVGPGRRAGLWVQGCTLACPGCASTETWDPNAGLQLTIEAAVGMLVDRFADDPSLTGLSLTGGEPIQQGGPLASTVRSLRAALSSAGRDLDVLLFTGYRLDTARRRAPSLLAEVDAVVAGRYRADLGFGGPLLGSANQRLHLLTDRARGLYTDETLSGSAVQVAANAGELVVVGIPRPGDLDRLRDRLTGAGITFSGVSWKP